MIFSKSSWGIFNTSFCGILPGKYIYGIILVMASHLQCQKVKFMTVYFSTNTNHSSFWCDFDWIINLWHYLGDFMSYSRSMFN